MMMMMLMGVAYWLSEHPSIIKFRWNNSQSWGATWWFLMTSITTYITLSLLLHLALTHVLRRRRPVPLGPIPAIHSLIMALISALIFSGLLLSSAAEIRDTRWLWRRSSTTPLQWFLCFPLGTRPTGRVFFWSYLFYLSRFLHLLRTFFAVLRRESLSFFRLFNHSILIFMSFLWLEFSQSFQVMAILLTTLVSFVVYGYRFWSGIGLMRRSDGGGGFDFNNFVGNCQVVLLGCNVVCHVVVLVLHLMRGGCNGIGAWVFNSVLNGAILMLFVNFYVKKLRRVRKSSVGVADNEVEASSSSSPKLLQS